MVSVGSWYKKKWLIVGLALILLVGLAFLVAYFATSGFTGTIKGKVVNELTRKPIDGAVVKVGKKSVRTKMNGSYELTGLPKGRVSLLVVAEGYEKYKKKIAVRWGQNRCDIELRDGIIYGQVVKGGLIPRPLGNAEVTVSGASARTNEKGNYRIENVKVGSQKITVEAPDCEKYKKEILVHAGDNKVNISLTPRESGVAGLSLGESLERVHVLYGPENERWFNEQEWTDNYIWNLTGNLVLSVETDAQQSIKSITVTGNSPSVVDLQGVHLGDTIKDTKQRLGEPLSTKVWSGENQQFYEIKYACGGEGALSVTYSASYEYPQKELTQDELEAKKITSISLGYD